jgi:hypothetical protein
MTSLPSYADYGTYDKSAHPDLWNGVVGYWAPCLGPTGLRLHDVSRGNNWGTLTNMDAASDWVVDGGQYALDFDGTNDYVQLSSVPIGGPLTVSVWFMASSVSSTAAIFSDTLSSGVAAAFQFEIGRTAGKLGVVWADSIIGNNSTTLSTSTLYHVVFVRRGYTGSWTAEFYVDGKADGSATTALNPASAGAFSIGRPGGFNGLYYGGEIFELTAWNRAISLNEAKAIYDLRIGGMLQRRRRRRVYTEQAGFRGYYATQRAQLIGGGLR